MKKGTKNNKTKEMDSAEVKKLFTKLTGGNKTMTEDQFYDFLGNDLGMDPEDPIFGHIATNLMGIKKIQEVTEENFEKLFKHTKVQSVKDLKNRIQTKQLHGEMKNAETFTSMYKKLFELYSGKYTTLDMSVAEQLWAIYFKDRMTLYKELLEFIGVVREQKLKVHKDLWNMMLEFSNQVKDVNKDYKEEDGWPVFMDRFVEYLKNKNK